MKSAIGFIRYGSLAPWLVVLALAIVVGFVEAIGAVLVYFVVGTIADPDRALDLPVIGNLQDRFPGFEEGSLFRYAAIAIAVFFLVRGCLTLCQIYLQHRTATRTGAALSARLMRGYLKMPLPWHLRRNSAELIRTANESVRHVVMYVFGPSVLLVSEGLVVVALLVVLLVAAPAATLAVLAVLGGVVLVLLRLVQSRLTALGEMGQEFTRQSLQSMQQSLSGLRDIKVLGREDFFTAEFDHVQQNLARTRYLHLTLTEMPRVTVETVVMVLVLGFVAIQGLQTSQTDDSLALIGLFAYAALRLMPTMNRVVRNLNQVRFGGGATALVAEDLRFLDEAATHPQQQDPLILRQKIAVDRVSFRYEGADEDVLSDVSLEIAAGESVGLVGATGGGKTTLIDLILGLLEPTDGAVRVDGVSIRGRERAWQQNLGVVPQATFLVDDTLRHNVALGVRDNEIDDDAVADALHLAQLEDFVRSLPEGWETNLGERGVRLSGGQRQRVAIARALYRRPSVLVFDEGTSALDNLTEAELIAALEQLRGERTLISVAHRITTVRKCDRIALIDRGRILDVGDYEELRARNADFRRMAG